MARWAIESLNSTHKTMVNLDTGEIREIPLASEKQIKYLESLRKILASDHYEPLRSRLTSFEASKKIEKAKARLQTERQQYPRCIKYGLHRQQITRLYRTTQQKAECVYKTPTGREVTGNNHKFKPTKTNENNETLFQ